MNAVIHPLACALLALWCCACDAPGPVGASDASLDLSSGDRTFNDVVTREDTRRPDLEAWTHADAIEVEYVPPPDRPTPPMDVPVCVSQSVAECVCIDGRAGLQACTTGGYYGRCGCVASPPPVGALGPRLLRPFSGLRSMTQRPTFRWVLPAGVARARIELCEDRLCARRVTQAEVSGTSWRPTETLRPGVVFWRVFGLGGDGTPVWTSATWEVGIRHRDTPVDSAWGPIKDFNGDGLDDLVAIAYASADDETRRPSSVYVLAGSRTTLLSDPVTARTDLPALGSRVAIGDVNGDGLADIALNALAPNRGSVSVYLGQRSGTLSERAALLSDETGLAIDATAIAIEDFNGDGFGDVIVFALRGEGDRRPNLRVYWGSVEGIRSSVVRASYFQAQVDNTANNQVAAIGDVDLDGAGDVAIIRFQGDSRILYGDTSTETENRTLPGEFGGPVGGNAIFGTDLNGDSIPDIVTGYPRNVAIGFGGSLILTLRTTRPALYSELTNRLYNRSRISRPADYNGDGIPDLADAMLCSQGVMQYECAETEVRVFRGLGGYLPIVADWRTDVTTSTFAGSPGDLNGDGFDDLVAADGTNLTVYLGRVETLERQGATFSTAAPIQHALIQPLL